MSIQISSNGSSSVNFNFKPVLGPGREDRWKTVTDIFKAIIEPLYGSQEPALSKIQADKDRKCRLLYDNETAVGVVVYKTKTSNEYGNHGIWNSLEIKTLCLTKPKEQSGRGYGSELLKKVDEAAREMCATSIHVTVNEQAQTSLNFFQKKGFKIVHTFESPHLKNKKEFILTKILDSKKTSYQESEKKQMKAENFDGSFKQRDEGELKRTAEDKPSLESQKIESDGKDQVSRKRSEHPEGDSSEPSSKRQRVDFSSNSRSNYSSSNNGGYSSSYREERPYNSDRRGSYDSSYSQRGGFSNSDYRSVPSDRRYSQGDYQSNNSNANSHVERIPLKRQYLTLIAKGEKTVEGRICNHPFNRLKEGTKITFFCTGSPDARCEITKVTRYNTFKEMLQTEGVSACLGRAVSSLEKGVEIYDSIPGYNDKAQRFGVLGIRIKLLK